MYQVSTYFQEHNKLDIYFNEVQIDPLKFIFCVQQQCAHVNALADINLSVEYIMKPKYVHYKIMTP